MGRIKSKTTLTIEQFPEQKDWIGRLFYVVNGFIQDAIAQINGNLVFGENITGYENEWEFEYVDDATSLPLEFKWKGSQQPKALYLVYAYESTPTTVGAPVALGVGWIYTAEGKVAITSVVKLTTSGATALVAGQRYRIRVRVTP